jgi:hypothetical protein
VQSANSDSISSVVTAGDADGGAAQVVAADSANYRGRVRQRYVPVGDDPYVVRRVWRDAVIMLVVAAGFVVLAVAVGGGVVIGAVAAVAVAAVFVTDALLDADRSGVALTIEERGVYFGRPPRELIPWSEIAEVELHFNTTSMGAESRLLSVRRGAPDDVDGYTRRHTVDHEAARRAVTRYTPSHVVIRDLTRR